MSKETKFIPFFSQSHKLWTLNIPPTLSPTTRRKILYFPTEAEAWAESKRQREQHKKYGTDYATLFADPLRRGEAAEVYKRLDAFKESTGVAFSLLSIVQAWIDRQEQKSRSIGLYDLFMQYLDTHPHLSHSHTSQILDVNKRFKDFWKTPVSEIESEQLQKVLSSLSGSTGNRYISTLNALWTFALKKEYTKANPVAKLDRVHFDKKPPQTFPNKVIEGMLNEALQNNLAMVPYFALGSFAGLRVGSGELNRLLWSDIYFEEKEIWVRAEIAKTRQSRSIDISRNLEAWLKAYLDKVPDHPKRVITLSTQLLRQARTEIFRKVAGKNAKYIQAGLRHTFASNHLAQHNDINTLVRELGHHGNVDMLWRHYHKYTRKADAQAFWNIFPHTHSS